MLKSGTVLASRYRIHSILGQGGMGAVYLAEMEALGGKKVAVKEMELAGLPKSELLQAVRQFKKEAAFLAHLDHQNLVKVSDFFCENGKHYLVMAYVPGQTLQQKMVAQGRPFRWDEIKGWAECLVDVLIYLHGQSPPILFRDLKPSNIMISDSGHLRLIDFGIARVAETGARTSTFLQGTGTKGFSPIEQYGGGQSTDERSDIYALGATLYYLLTGKLPTDAVERVSQSKALLPLAHHGVSAPEGMDALIRKALALSQCGRYQSAKAFKAAMQALDSPEIDGESPTEGYLVPAPAATLEGPGPMASEPLLSGARREFSGVRSWQFGLLAVASMTLIAFAMNPSMAIGPSAADPLANLKIGEADNVARGRAPRRVLAPALGSASATPKDALGDLVALGENRSKKRSEAFSSASRPSEVAVVEEQTASPPKGDARPPTLSLGEVRYPKAHSVVTKRSKAVSSQERRKRAPESSASASVNPAPRQRSAPVLPPKERSSETAVDPPTTNASFSPAAPGSAESDSQRASEEARVAVTSSAAGLNSGASNRSDQTPQSTASPSGSPPGDLPSVTSGGANEPGSRPSPSSAVGALRGQQGGAPSGGRGGPQGGR